MQCNSVVWVVRVAINLGLGHTRKQQRSLPIGYTLELIYRLYTNSYIGPRAVYSSEESELTENDYNTDWYIPETYMYHHDLRCTGVHVEEIRQLFWTELCDSLDSSIMKGMYSIPSSSVNRRIAFHFSQAFIEMGYIVFKWMQFQWTTYKQNNKRTKEKFPFSWEIYSVKL